MTRRPDGIWALNAHLLPGAYSYKAALNKSWDVNYGLNAAPGGANIPLAIPAAGADVTFLYDPATHWITDTLNTAVVTATGDFLDELGCTADATDCLSAWLTDPDGDGNSTFTTTALPAGTYHAKAALHLPATPLDGTDTTFTVAQAGDATTFSYTASSRVLSIYAGQPKPSLAPRSAYWLTADTIAWNLGDNPAATTYQLATAPDGGLTAAGTGITGGTSIPLVRDPKGLSAALAAKYPHLAKLTTLRVPKKWSAQAKQLAKGQSAVAALDSNGNLTTATGLQTAGLLDTLYAAKAADAEYGPVFNGNKPTLSLWAPTAQSVSIELYDTSTSTQARIVAMTLDPATGTWAVKGDKTWNGLYYRYQVKVWAPTVLKTVTNHVTDPYSLALSADSQRSQIVNLDEDLLMPHGWDDTASPKTISSTQQQIQELHVRDFSSADTALPADERGTYLAFTDAKSAGVKHLKDLAAAGLTTVQILPSFDFAGTAERRADQATPGCDLPAMAPDSDQQQACVAGTQADDAYNWGYNPLHFTVPEGSYATAPDGAARTIQFRQMVQALHQAGLRVVMDVVYNHTAAAGQDPNSVLDQIVPGYYQRLDTNGTVTRDSCCADTAPENAMMNKLVVDSVTTWAQQYHVDGFRFDLMGLDPKRTMLDVKTSLGNLTQHRDGIDGKSTTLYGEGWNYGVVANDSRFVQATQANMAGTGIGTFNDRLRDAVRGGGPSDTDPREQGFATGQYTNPNGAPLNGTTEQQKTDLLHDMDLVKLGLTGNLADYTFTTSTGTTRKGAQIDYNGTPAGYTAAPGEAITYVDAHDNLALYDSLAYKLPTGTSPAERARIQALALATSTLSQGPGMAQAGTDLLRSKSLDGNSYDSGDWFNAIHWDCTQGNGFGHGLPLGGQSQWSYAKPLLANPALVPNCTNTTNTSAQYQQFLQIKHSTPLFSLPTANAVQQRLTFPLSGTPGEIPGVITEHLDGRGLDTYKSVTVLYNATATTQTQTLTNLAGSSQALHPVQNKGADPTVKQSQYNQATGTFTVPAHTVAVFVQQ
ncbi:pullulanase-type alpha-1,6-glucosidase [Streptomyces sp. So13.3]|uniref:pullulanase-type alpha-1,6-glucosidase n=2 Tax=Streptomyces TaxID=1883 RepID=UPI00164D0F71|nr:pullulanase-type alpha-1,6-glucosidase [Streptomyces sp. So13.3]QNA77550.1 pullulanase-type alpha-1,6-glucosidase [Streptomyces sp. So13.3]